MKIHLHETQFDNWLHAACRKLDAPHGDKRIVLDDDFERLPKIARCAYCSKIYYPHGESL